MQITIELKPPEACIDCKFKECHRHTWTCKLMPGEIARQSYFEGRKISEYCISDIDFKYMLHAIGYGNRKIKKGKYEAYRNYYATTQRNDIWENLVDRGLAEYVGTSQDKYITYKVSKKGIEVLEWHLGIKIEEV